MDYPFYTLAHSKKNHEMINDEYAMAKDNLNKVIDNPILSSEIVGEALMPIGIKDENLGAYVQQQIIQTTMGLSKAMPYVANSLYGNFEPDIYGKAEFLDTYHTMQDPEYAINHISQGRATHTQVSTLAQNYPSIWEQYKGVTLNDVTNEDLHPSDRLAIYAYTGIETHPNVSYAEQMKSAQIKMAAQQSQPQSAGAATQRNTQTQQSKATSELPGQRSAPFTSPEGRKP